MINKFASFASVLENISGKYARRTGHKKIKDNRDISIGRMCLFRPVRLPTRAQNKEIWRRAQMQQPKFREIR